MDDYRAQDVIGRAEHEALIDKATAIIEARERDMYEAMRERDEAREQLRGAVEVIERYARHDDQCRSQRVLGQGPCNCGYEAARSAVFGGGVDDA